MINKFCKKKCKINFIINCNKKFVSAKSLNVLIFSAKHYPNNKT